MRSTEQHPNGSWGFKGSNGLHVPPKSNGYDPQTDFAKRFEGDPDSEPTKPWTFAGPVPTLSWWLERELADPDYLLGELISTTSRILLVAPTGLGKTNIGLALSVSLTTGLDFLHWKAIRPARVLYIDGEMPARLIKRRLADTARRRDCQSDDLVLLSREDYPDMPPLNTLDGQRFIDGFMVWAGAFDVIFFDNIQALLTGDMKDPMQWATMLNWVRNLTKRKIGQVWVHHTGHDETHSYGDKTREWQFDTMMLLEKIERPDSDIAFNLKFTKARERTPENRADFSDAVITLANDEWSSERGGASSRGGRKPQLEDIALRALDEALAKAGDTPRNHPKIPSDTLCVTQDLWQRYFEQVQIGDAKPESVARAFRMYAAKLQVAGKVSAVKPWVWRNK
jgi:hypothetical protein